MRSAVALLLLLSPPVPVQPSAVSAGPADVRNVGGRLVASSTRLNVAWPPEENGVDHYRVVATEALGTSVSATAVADSSTIVLAGLESATSYTITVSACGDAECEDARAIGTAVAATESEYWHLQGTGHAVQDLAMPVADGNARLSATRFGPEAGPMADRIQFYYGPFGTGRRSPLSTAATTTDTSADDPSSYLTFTSRAGTTGLVSPPSPAPLVRSVATGQGVPLSEALGANVRLFFEAQGEDGRTRVLSVDSLDGYVGQDFNAGDSGICEATADYAAGGGCEPSVVIGVEGDGTGGNPGIRNARQFKLGWPALDDWRWDGAPGRFMVFTTDDVPGCTTGRTNHGYAVWDGSRFVVQYADDGCPKLFENVQAALPMHVGGARYKMYYGDRTHEEGRYGTSRLPFLGPKVVIYADGRTTGAPDIVDFEDWEPRSAARDVVFLWPDGSMLDERAEGYIDDFHFLAPTGSLDLQVMYLTITDGVVIPIAATAVLVNP